MNFNNYTIKSQEAIQQAQQLAQSYGHQQIENEHVFKGILEVDENVLPFLLKKLNTADLLQHNVSEDFTIVHLNKKQRSKCNLLKLFLLDNEVFTHEITTKLQKIRFRSEVLVT